MPSLVVVHGKDGALKLIKNQQKSDIVPAVGSTDFLLTKSAAETLLSRGETDEEGVFFVDDGEIVVEWKIQCLFAICHADS